MNRVKIFIYKENENIMEICTLLMIMAISIKITLIKVGYSEKHNMFQDLH